jgi:hypothetical protein
MKSEARRFWEKTEQRECGCIEWTASLNGRGYGQFRPARQRKNVTAHRYSWVLANGEIPKGLCVCHACDNRKCVNPEHLFLGTLADNSADMVSKGRGKGANRAGILNPRRKLTEIEVEAIRHSTASLRSLADAFGIGKSQVHRIKKGMSWSDQLAA